MRFLPDTNIIIGWTTGRVPGIAGRMAAHRRDIGLSAIVFHELAFGAFNSRQVEQNLQRLDGLGLPVLPFETDDARVAGRIRAALRRQGTPIGPYDVLIAGQALARDLTLVTANVREFSRVEGLRIEDWSAV